MSTQNRKLDTPKLSTQGQSLLDSARGGNVDQVQNLLVKGTDPSIKDRTGFTSLHYAAKGGKVSLVELLLVYGADPDVKDISGLTSLHYAAQDGHIQIVQLLLENCADPNVQNDSGSTPLHIAAKGKKVSVVKLLLDAGADKEIQDDKGNTSMHISTEPDIARLLLGDSTVFSLLAMDVPLFPITINGNTLNPSILNAGPLKTKYILVQSWADLSSSDRLILEKANIRPLDYVSRNTYLCQYEDEDLEKVRKLEPVVYVDIYRTELKIGPILKEARRGQKYKVDVVFHENVATDSQSLQTELKEKSHCDMEKINFLSIKARLLIDGLCLDDVASIDDVCCMEEVGEVVASNDVARQILNINPQPPAGLIPQRVYGLL